MGHVVPYKIFTSIMTKSLFKGAVDLLNHFLSKNSISDTMIPFKWWKGRENGISTK